MENKLSFMMVYAGLIIMAVTLVWTCIPALQTLARERRGRVLYHLINMLSQVATIFGGVIIYRSVNLVPLLFSFTEKFYIFVPFVCLWVLLFAPYYYFASVHEVSKY